MNYNLKDKIEVTEEFLSDLIAKGWHETEALQQQIANIDTTSTLGSEVIKLLKNACTNYYVLIGCLEDLMDTRPIINDATREHKVTQMVQKQMPNTTEIVTPDESQQTASNDVAEPFEYFVDFDEPLGEPITDSDLYS